MIPLRRAAPLVLSTLVACNALIGTRDLTFDPSAPGAGADGGGGGGDGDATPAGPDATSGTDASVLVDATCDSDSDAKNCGKCGHDCLGGECKAGRCQPFEIAKGQAQPLGVTVLGDAVYWTNYGSDTVTTAKKDGTGVTLFAKNAKFVSPWGITNDGTSINLVYIKQVTEEKAADPSIRSTVTAHREDLIYLEGAYRGQVNGEIQTAYNERGRYEELGDPDYRREGGIFDIMAVTVIHTHLSSAA